MVHFVYNWQAHLSKWIQPPYIISMFLRAKLKQETEERISTASLHYCLFKSTTPIKNIESHRINDMYEMIVIRRNNIDVRYIWSKYLHIQASKLQTHISQHRSKWLRGGGEGRSIGKQTAWLSLLLLAYSCKTEKPDELHHFSGLNGNSFFLIIKLLSCTLGFDKLICSRC